MEHTVQILSHKEPRMPSKHEKSPPKGGEDTVKVAPRPEPRRVADKLGQAAVDASKRK